MRSLRELLLAMTDSRVVIIKLAKRLQTMRTVNENVSRSIRGKLAEETLAVFVPIANRLGMATIKNEMEDICFKT
jgi:(p)ppGpp synthase/HD superfamily hydrolase